MQLNNFVLDAVNAVLDWDIPEEAYPEAVNAQLRAGQQGDDVLDYGLDPTVH